MEGFYTVFLSRSWTFTFCCCHVDPYCICGNKTMNPGLCLDSVEVLLWMHPPRVCTAPLSSSGRQSSIVLSSRGWNHFISTCVSSSVFPQLLSVHFYVILCTLWDRAILCCLMKNKLTPNFWKLDLNYVWTLIFPVVSFDVFLMTEASV